MQKVKTNQPNEKCSVETAELSCADKKSEGFLRQEMENR